MNDEEAVRAGRIVKQGTTTVARNRVIRGVREVRPPGPLAL